MLVAFELIKAGAGRSQQDNVAGFGRGIRLPDGILQGLGVHHIGGFNLRFNLRRGRADRVDALHSLAQQVVQYRVVAALVLAAENQVEVCRERFQRLDGRVHVGGLGVVVVVDAADGRHKFQAMFDRLEIAHRLANFLGCASHQSACAHGGQNILEIVCAFQRYLGNLHDLALRHSLFAPSVRENDVAITKDDVAVTHPRALLNFFLPAEPEHLSARPGSHRYAGGIVGIENRKVASLLVFEDAGFRVHINVKRPVAVEVVRRDVQHDRDFGTESLNRLQLKTGNLEHNDGFRLGALRQRNRRRANVATDECWETCGRHDFSQERGGRGLAIRSGNRDDRPGQESRRKFDLANHRLAQSARLHQGRRVDRDARAHHDQILFTKRAVPVASGFDRNAVIEQSRNLIAQFIAALGVGDRHLRPMRLQEQS